MAAGIHIPLATLPHALASRAVHHSPAPLLQRHHERPLRQHLPAEAQSVAIVLVPWTQEDPLAKA